MNTLVARVLGENLPDGMNSYPPEGRSYPERPPERQAQGRNENPASAAARQILMLTRTLPSATDHAALMDLIHQIEEQANVIISASR